MGSKKKEQLNVIKTKAVINSLTVGCHEDKISFTSLSLNADEDGVITDIVKSESDVMLNIDLEVPDPNFPAIEVKGKLKKFTINKTCDSPNMINIQFSSGQAEQLTNYIRSEQEIVLKFTKLQQELPFEEEDKDVGDEAA